MARRDPEYGYPSLGRTIDFANSTSCSYIEILQYPDHVEPFQAEGTLDDSSLPDWLSKSLSRPNSSTSTSRSQAPLGGLRLLFGICGFNPSKGCQIVPFKEELFALLETQLCITKYFRTAMIRDIARAFITTQDNPSGNQIQCFVLKQGIYRPGYYQIALSHNIENNITHGLILAKTKDHEYPKLISGLKDRKMFCRQPLLLAALVTEIVIDSSEELIRVSHFKIDALEETMGQHEYVNRPKGNPFEIDFISTTSALNTTNRTIAVQELRIGAVLLQLGSILDNSKNMNNSLKDRVSDARASSAVPDGLVMMEEFIEFQINACKSLLLRAEYEKRRIQILIAVVYQFMAQKDAKVNIALAKDTSLLAKASKEDSYIMKTIAIESKKDSSAMKTIAILTMSFLPGTFIAAIFAMPMFDWDNDGSPTVKSGFKYYWAIAIPLTFLVLLLWSLAVLLPWRSWLPRPSKFGLRSERRELELDLVAAN